MASRKALLIAAAMAVVVVGALLLETASADNYLVGDHDGWDLGVDYDDWARRHTDLKVGDTLEFVYGLEASHSVVMVDPLSFAACTVPSNAPTLTSGDDVVTLNQAGQWLFICGVEDHCNSGMKLNVNVN